GSKRQRRDNRDNEPVRYAAGRLSVALRLQSLPEAATRPTESREAHICAVNTSPMACGALQLNRGGPAWPDVTLCNELLLLIDAAVAHLPHDGAAEVTAGATRGGRRMANPTATRLLLQRAAGGALPGEICAVHYGFFFTVNAVVASSGSPCARV
ncbi:MAG: hypothetical protein RI921_1011, partial [Chloroflexota bacterium]